MYVRDGPAKATCILESSNNSNWYLNCCVLAAASAVPWADVWGWSRAGVPSAFSHLRTQAQIAGCILSPMRERAREKGWGEHWPTSPLPWGESGHRTPTSRLVYREYFFPELAVFFPTWLYHVYHSRALLTAQSWGIAAAERERMHSGSLNATSSGSQCCAQQVCCNHSRKEHLLSIY